jgi:hypothetical protein
VPASAVLIQRIGSIAIDCTDRVRGLTVTVRAGRVELDIAGIDVVARDISPAA